VRRELRESAAEAATVPVAGDVRSCASDSMSAEELAASCTLAPDRTRSPSVVAPAVNRYADGPAGRSRHLLPLSHARTRLEGCCRLLEEARNERSGRGLTPRGATHRDGTSAHRQTPPVHRVGDPPPPGRDRGPSARQVRAQALPRPRCHARQSGRPRRPPTRAPPLSRKLAVRLTARSEGRKARSTSGHRAALAVDGECRSSRGFATPPASRDHVIADISARCVFARSPPSRYAISSRSPKSAPSSRRRPHE